MCCDGATVPEAEDGVDVGVEVDVIFDVEVAIEGTVVDCSVAEMEYVTEDEVFGVLELALEEIEDVVEVVLDVKNVVVDDEDELYLLDFCRQIIL